MTNQGKALLLATTVGVLTVGATAANGSAVVQGMKALLVRDADAPALRSFQIELCTQQNNPNLCPPGSNAFTVPEFTAAGESVVRGVVEHVSARCIFSPLESFVMEVRLVTTADGISSEHYFEPVRPADAAALVNLAQPVRLYADPGTPLMLATNVVATLSLCDMTISGHLVVEPERDAF